MASTPYFILSPSTLLSLVGLFRGPDETVPTPAEDWRQATVDVVIPAFNEERHIVRSLASLLNQRSNRGRSFWLTTEVPTRPSTVQGHSARTPASSSSRSNAEIRLVRPPR